MDGIDPAALSGCLREWPEVGLPWLLQGPMDKSLSAAPTAPNLAESESEQADRPHILLGISGSVAAIKTAELAELLCALGEVRIVATDASRHFLSGLQLPPEVQHIHGDEEEWRAWQAKGDPVQHIELRKWADILVIAPLSANTLAKMAQGLCDNCLTSVVRAWDWSKPLLVAPAMNTLMWESPLTSQHLKALNTLGAWVIDPVHKTLACGDTGAGAMAAVQDITHRVQLTLAQPGEHLSVSVSKAHPASGMYARLCAYCRTSQCQAIFVLVAALAMASKVAAR